GIDSDRTGALPGQAGRRRGDVAIGRRHVDHVPAAAGGLRATRTRGGRGYRAVGRHRPLDRSRRGAAGGHGVRRSTGSAGLHRPARFSADDAAPPPLGAGGGQRV
ncbi:MAG: hypothetical protein AVDCRST_MAG88-2533, partial [uncultured Thermomicrobiales bacterium]